MFKRIERAMFPEPTPMEYAKEELAAAKIKYLVACTALEYAQSEVLYRASQNERLEKYVKDNVIPTDTHGLSIGHIETARLDVRPSRS